ncbi:DUF6449 domain-containing protein [Oscillospiraceae bacterium PP1C4]
MTTTTSFSKKDRFNGLYKSTFRRNIGYFGLVCALLFIFYPFQYAMEAFKPLNPEQVGSLAIDANSPFQFYRFYGLGQNFTTVSAIFFTMTVLLTPMILALVLGSYMHSKKAADVYHALPIKREMLITVNAAVAMSFIAIPLIASNLIIAFIQITKFGFLPEVLGYLLLDTAGWLIAAFCIYTVTTFVSVCVGTVFDAFVFSGALLLSAPILCGLYLMLAETFLFGFHTDETIMMTIFNLSPVTMMPARFILGAADFTLEPEFLRQLFSSNLALIIYLALSAVLFMIAMKLYHNRHSEIAETTTSKGILQIIIKFLGTIICGVCVGMIFYQMTSISENSQQKMVFIVWTIIGGMIAYAISEIILNRGFKTLVKSLPLGVGMVAVTIGGSLAIMTGGFGYENRVPSPDSIASVETSYKGRYSSYDSMRIIGPTVIDQNGVESPTHINNIHTVYLTDPQSIETVRGFHSDVAARKLKSNEPAGLEPSESFVWCNTSVTYHLKNGRELTRYYQGVGTNSLMKLAPLETSGEFLTQTHGAFYTDAKDVIEWKISDIYGSKNLTQVYSPADSKALLEAIQADLTATSLEELLHPSQHPIASISYTTNYPKEGSKRFTSQAYFIITSPNQQTYQFLQKKGVLDQLKVDLSKCYAITAGLENNGSRGGDDYSAIVQLNPAIGEFAYSEFENVKANIEEARKYREEHPEAYDSSMPGYDPYASKYGYEVTQLFEDQADIQAMANAMVGSYNISEPLVYANFYFEGAFKGNSVLVPLSSLPKDLQDKFSKTYSK